MYVFASRAGGTMGRHEILEAMLLRLYSAHQLGRRDQRPVYRNSSLTVKPSKSIPEAENHHHRGF